MSSALKVRAKYLCMGGSLLEASADIGRGEIRRQEGGIPGPTVESPHAATRLHDETGLLDLQVSMSAGVGRGRGLRVARVVGAEHLTQIRDHRPLPAQGKHLAVRQIL